MGQIKAELTGSRAMPIWRQALQDALARTRRALEALLVGDIGLAEAMLDDLGHDLWNVIERMEKDA